jgi:CheY-like chemotaxis protein
MAERILIVEDEPNMVKMLSMTLEASGYSIQSAQNAETGLRMIQEAPPDLLILDIMLPQASGLELLKAIRQDSTLESLPVIILSAIADVEAKVVGLEAGADEYLTKPIEARELVARVSSILQRTARLRGSDSDKHGKIVSFIGVKGGVGTSTTALHIAALAAAKIPGVILLELQPAYSSFARQLGLRNHKHIGNLPQDDPEKLQSFSVDSVVTKHPLGFSLICSFPSYEEAVPINEPMATKILHDARKLAGLVLVDLPPARNEATKAALQLSDLVILLVEPTPQCLDAALAMIGALRVDVSSSAQFGCILVNRSAIASSLSANEIQEQLGVKVLGTVPQAADVLSSAYKRSNLLLTEQPNHAVTNTLGTLAKLIIEQLRIKA